MSQLTNRERFLAKHKFSYPSAVVMHDYRLCEAEGMRYIKRADTVFVCSIESIHENRVEVFTFLFNRKVTTVLRFDKMVFSTPVEHKS